MTHRTGMQRSWHVGRYRELEPLPDGTLVYLEVDGDNPVLGRDQGVHPVMIGRDVFPRPPGSRLPPSLRPARSRGSSCRPPTGSSAGSRQAEERDRPRKAATGDGSPSARSR